MKHNQSITGYDQVLPGGPVDYGFDSFIGPHTSTDIPPYFYIRGNCAVAPLRKMILRRKSRNTLPT